MNKVEFSWHQMQALEKLRRVQELSAQIASLKQEMANTAFEGLSYAVAIDVDLKPAFCMGHVNRIDMAPKAHFVDINVEDWVQLDLVEDVVGSSDIRVVERMSDAICEMSWAFCNAGGFDARVKARIPSRMQFDSAEDVRMAEISRQLKAVIGDSGIDKHAVDEDQQRMDKADSLSIAIGPDPFTVNCAGAGETVVVSVHPESDGLIEMPPKSQVRYKAHTFKRRAA